MNDDTVAVAGLVVSTLAMLVALLTLVVQVVAWLQPRTPGGGPGLRIPARWLLAAACAMVLSLAYLGAVYVVPTRFSYSAVDRIKARGELRVGLNDNAAPFSSATATGGFQGFEVAIAREFARTILGDPELVEFVPVKGSNRFSRTFLRGNDVDLVMSLLSSHIRDGRQDVLAFSRPYYLTGQRILVRRDSPITSLADLHGKTACVVELERTAKARYLVAKAPGVRIVDLPESRCVNAVAAGEVDAVSSDEWKLLSVLSGHPDLELRGERVTNDVWAVGVPKNLRGYGALRETVNEILTALIAGGGWQRIYRDHIEPLSHEQPVLPTAGS